MVRRGQTGADPVRQFVAAILRWRSDFHDAWSADRSAASMADAQADSGLRLLGALRTRELGEPVEDKALLLTGCGGGDGI